MDRKHGKEKRNKDKRKSETKSSTEQKVDAQSLKEQKLEIMFVAQDVFHYLSSQVFPEDPIKASGEKSHFQENIGKACSYKIQFARVSLDEIYAKDFPDGSLGSKDFLVWFHKKIVCSFFKIPSTPFNVMIESLAYMFDVIAHAKKRNQTSLYRLTPFIWTDFFMKAMYPEFFQDGGWQALLRRARDIVNRYENFFLKSEPGAMELIAGLRKNDPTRTVEGATGGINPEKQLPVPQHLQRAGLPPKMDESSELAKALKELMHLKAEGAIRRFGLASEDPNVPGATSQEELPGCRKTYRVGPMDIPQIERPSDSGSSDSELDSDEESSTGTSDGITTDIERVPALGLFSETPNRAEESGPSESIGSREHTLARQQMRKRVYRKKK